MTIMRRSEAHYAAWQRWWNVSKDHGVGGLDPAALEHLTDGDLKALEEDRTLKQYVAKERAQRAAPAAFPQLPPIEKPRSALAQLDVRKEDALEDVFQRNRPRAAPVALVENVFRELFECLGRIDKFTKAGATKNRDRNFKIAELCRTLGLEPGLPPMVDRGRWEAGILYYADDWVRHAGADDHRCLVEHRADASNQPGTDGALNLWEPIDAPKAPAADGSSVLERLAVVEHALGITRPEGRR